MREMRIDRENLIEVRDGEVAGIPRGEEINVFFHSHLLLSSKRHFHFYSLLSDVCLAVVCVILIYLCNSSKSAIRKEKFVSRMNKTEIPLIVVHIFGSQ